MKLKSFLQKLILGETLLLETDSVINGNIRVYDSWFGKEMQIGKVSQSGELVERVWKAGLLAISCTKSDISNCLILGLGCGNAAKIIAKKWPNAKITGIEIDPTVVEIGKKYFALGKISNLEIIVGDAIKKTINTKFDLILVDLYLGQDFPKEAESEVFLQGLKKILDKNGMVVINRLYYSDSLKEKAEEFLLKVKAIFPKVNTKEAVTNLLIFASN